MILEDEREAIHRALLKYNSHGQYFLPEEDLNTVNYLMSCLCDFLNADAELVRHGQWIGLEYDGYADGNPVYDLWECSCCNCEWDGEEDTLPSYCPDCGAKMDGEVDNE